MATIKLVKTGDGTDHWINENGHHIQFAIQTNGYVVEPNFVARNKVVLWTEDAARNSTLILDRSRYEVQYQGVEITDIKFIDSTVRDIFSPNLYTTSTVTELEINPSWYDLFMVEVTRTRTDHLGNPRNDTEVYPMKDYYENEFFKTESAA